MDRISAVIIARDEALRIEAAIASVRPWVDEVLVLDGGSTDATVDLARRAGARVESHPFDGFVAQKTRATAMARWDLVFSLDADELVGPFLGRALREVAQRGAGPTDPPGAAAWSVSRLNYLDGRALRASGWSPDRRIRLFDRRRARWTGSDPHDRLVADGPVGRLPGFLHHDPSRTTRDYVRGTIRHARHRARSLVDEGRRPGPLAPWLHGSAHLLRKVVFSGAPLDGRRGMTVAWVGALGAARKYRLASRLGAEGEST